LDWFQSGSYTSDSLLPGDEVKVVCCPCQHFSGRSLTDKNDTLWASWAIITPKCRYFFGGDTGLNAVPKDATPEQLKELPFCPAFKHIGHFLGPFDLSSIPIGAYSPRWIMSPVHLNPSDAVRVHMLIKSKQSIGMHWGTFILTDEPIWDPPKKLAEALKENNLSAGEFVAIHHGQTQAFPLINN